jgi:anaerobic selenocysteine-containing dehydrogenase
VELYSTTFESYGLDPLPYHEEPIESPMSTPDIYAEYPLILITGRRVATLYHSEHRQIPWLRQFEKEPYVEIHPDTAREIGILDGEWIWIEGVRGKVKRKARLTPVVHPKTVMAPHGWWYPEKEGAAPHLYGIWDINVNQLIPMGHQGKSGFGGAPLKTMLCKIYPLTNER